MSCGYLEYRSTKRKKDENNNDKKVQSINMRITRVVSLDLGKVVTGVEWSRTRSYDQILASLFKPLFIIIDWEMFRHLMVTESYN